MTYEEAEKIFIDEYKIFLGKYLEYSERTFYKWCDMYAEKLVVNKLCIFINDKDKDDFRKAIFTMSKKDLEDYASSFACNEEESI